MAVPLLDVVLGYDCNLGCSYCTITPAMRRRALPTARVAAALSEAFDAGYRDVAFTGGEPTIFEDLPRLVRLARSLGYEHVKVASNGLRYAHEPYLDLLVRSGVDRFHVSVHAPSDAAYDATVRREGAAALRQRAIEALVRRDLDPTADLILKEDTYREVGAWIASLHALGVRRFALWLLSLTDQAANLGYELPRMTDVAPHVVQAFDAARAGDYEVVSLHLPRCLLPGYEEHVRHPGSDRVRVITPDDTFELSGSRLSGGSFPEACAPCRFRSRCCGLRADYAARHGTAEVRPS
ncbi:MAG: radical SAM protein [Myxococcales bacterium]|nr:radical SAM protein [Myxococcales bacterium]